jgi:ADP-ribose pyrophosphatase YjhB (NUDIX family)
MGVEGELRRLGDELRVLAEDGLRWSGDDAYHQDRYERVRRAAATAFALADRRDVEEIERTVFRQLTHHAPMPTADAAVIDDDGRILLIQRADDGLWAMPGGAIHMEETAAEGAAREAREEAGVEVDVMDLVGVYDSRYCASGSPLQLYMFTFLCQLVDVVEASTPDEVLATAWFAESELPALSAGHDRRVPDVFRFLRDGRVAFDGARPVRRDAAVEALVAAHDPIGVHDETVWGVTGLRLHAYAGEADLPDELVTSMRCLVVVPGEAGPRLVVCQTVHGDTHPWPGGRREAGETFADTIVREVHEETGWHVDPASIVRLGWLRLAISTPRPAVPFGPHPDFLHIVCAAVARDRDGDPAVEWTDVMGYEVSSTLVPLDRAAATFDDPVARWFVERARDLHR